jgi:hypothetical protein
MHHYSMALGVLISSISFAQKIDPMRDPVPTRDEGSLARELGCSDSCRWTGRRMDGKPIVLSYYQESVNHCQKHFAESYAKCSDSVDRRNERVTAS